MALDLEALEMVTATSPSSKWIMDVAQKFWENHDPKMNQRIPLAKVKDSLLQTEEADRMPNALVIELLQKADMNNDGYIDHEEYMNFAESACRVPRVRNAFSRMTLTVVPRHERSAEKRYYLQMYSCCPPPLFMLIASLLETGVFIYYMVDMGHPMAGSGPVPFYSELIYNPFRRYEAWRFLTYALVHSGYMHLIGNLVVQLILGVALELVHGWWRIGLIYVSGVLFGSLAYSITSPSNFVSGASGGVFAVEYAHLGNLLMNWSQMEYRWLQLIFILLLSISQLTLAVWDTYYNPRPSNTGHMGHLGGAIAGITVGTYILRNFHKKKWEKYLWWVAIVVFFLLVVIGIILHAALPVPDYFPYNNKDVLGQAKLDYFNRKWDWLLPPKEP